MQLEHLFLNATLLSNDWIKEVQTECQHSGTVVTQSATDLFTMLSKKEGGYQC